MKHLLTILITGLLMMACSNPADSLQEYAIHYVADAPSAGGWLLNARWYNPQTGQIETAYWPDCNCGWASFPNAQEYDDYIAHSGQTLWFQNISDDRVGSAQIWVDGELVAESIVSDSVYVEYALP